MKNFTRKIWFSLALAGMLIPQLALAQDTDLSGLGMTKFDGFGEEKNCYTAEEEVSMSITILEETLDTPDSESESSPTGPGARKCVRYTEILKHIDAKGKVTKEAKNYILDKCPENLPDTGTDDNGQYFDCQEVTVILVDPEAGGLGVLQIYLGLVYRWAAGIVGIIAVLVIIISGIQISTADGEPSKVDEAKTRIFQSLGGVALLFLASGLLYLINPTFFDPPDYQGPTQDSSVDTEDPNLKKEIKNDPGYEEPSQAA